MTEDNGRWNNNNNIHLLRIWSRSIQARIISGGLKEEKMDIPIVIHQTVQFNVDSRRRAVTGWVH